MSNIVQAYVWTNSRHKSNDLLGLVALAEWSNDYGLAWPSIDRLKERLRFSDIRAARFMLRRIEGSGELLTLEHRGLHHTNVYLVTLPFAGRELSWILQNQLPVKRMGKSQADELAERILERRGFDIPPNIEIVEQGSLRSPFRRAENRNGDSGFTENENRNPRVENRNPGSGFQDQNRNPHVENRNGDSGNPLRSEEEGLNLRSSSLPHLRNGHGPKIVNGAAQLLVSLGVAPKIADELGKRPELSPAVVFVTAANLIAECEKSDRLEFGAGLLVHRLRSLPKTATVPELKTSPLAPKHHENCFGLECCNDADDRFGIVSKKGRFDAGSRSAAELVNLMGRWESRTEEDFRAR